MIALLNSPAVIAVFLIKSFFLFLLIVYAGNSEVII